MSSLTLRQWPTAEWTALPLPEGQAALWWLGQAGFAIRFGPLRLLVDPYLSDSLARKYAGTEFPHARLMPPPLDPAALPGLDAVLCTHAHTDHMDPDTLAPLARNNPACRFVVPRAAADVALARGVPADRLVGLDDGEEDDLAAGVAVHALASAHEELETNERGEHRFLGYVLRLGGLHLYHSGDCVPYAGLDARLAGETVHVALLPVNGRDAYRRSHGVPGNFTFAEAAALCARLDIPFLVPHHFGMFEHNTVPRERLEAAIRAGRIAGWVRLPEPDAALVLGS